MFRNVMQQRYRSSLQLPSIFAVCVFVVALSIWYFICVHKNKSVDNIVRQRLKTSVATFLRSGMHEFTIDFGQCIPPEWDRVVVVPPYTRIQRIDPLVSSKLSDETVEIISFSDSVCTVILIGVDDKILPIHVSRKLLDLSL